MKNTYWNDNGKYQSMLNEMEQLIPNEGPTGKLGLEILRCGNNIYWDYYNNGFGNKWEPLARFLKYKALIDVPYMIERYADGEMCAIFDEDNDYELEQMNNLEEILEKFMDEVILRAHELIDQDFSGDAWETR